MGNELLKKMNNNNYKIINELIEIITDEKINKIDELYNYQNNFFKIDGKNLSHEEQIEYCKKQVYLDPFINENIDFMDVQKIMKIKEQLKNEVSDKEKVILLIRLMVLLGKGLCLPYDAYILIMNNEL